MPCDYSKYPPNWKTEIRPRILARADNKCEQEGCGAANNLWGYHDKEGKFWSSQMIHDELEKGVDVFHEDGILGHIPLERRAVKIVLTIAHLDHDITNNDDSNLKALCQRHHLALDKQQHTKNARETNRKKKGLQNLFNAQFRYSKEDGIAVVSFLEQNGFKVELIGSLSKIGFSNHDIDIHVMNSGTKEDRDKLKRLFVTKEKVDETDWGGLYFNNTQFGDVDIFFSLDGFDY
jgi:hypothetical protein